MGVAQVVILLSQWLLIIARSICVRVGVKGEKVKQAPLPTDSEYVVNDISSFFTQGLFVSRTRTIRRSSAGDG